MERTYSHLFPSERTILNRTERTKKRRVRHRRTLQEPLERNSENDLFFNLLKGLIELIFQELDDFLDPGRE